MNVNEQAAARKAQQEQALQKRRRFVSETEGKELTAYRDRYNLEMSKRRLQQLEEDSAHQVRTTETLQCKFCCYMGGGFAGQAFTNYQCQICGIEDRHHCTAVPLLCKDCARREGLCVDCGNALDN